MTEDTKPGIRPLTEGAVMAHLKGLLDSIHHRCPVCQGDSFVLACQISPEGHLVPYQLVASLYPVQTFATLPFVCENCGYVTFFAHKTVGEKIAEREQNTTPL